MQVDPDEELAQLERLRLADGEPMSIEESYLVHRLCPGILDSDYTQHPLRRALDQKYGIHLVRASQKIQAISASPKLAEKLSIPSKSALLYIERVSYSDQGIPIEFLRLYHRGDRYSLYNELRD